jgi:hypothetical protein
VLGGTGRLYVRKRGGQEHRHGGCARLEVMEFSLASDSATERFCHGNTPA